jgi:hypothetical protein
MILVTSTAMIAGSKTERGHDNLVSRTTILEAQLRSAKAAKDTPAEASKTLGVTGQDLATSLQARQPLLQCGNSLIRGRKRSSMFFQECRLLAL